jgi:hypothetical protein
MADKFMAGKTVALTMRRAHKAAATLCTGMIARIAALGWDFVGVAEAMNADELKAHIEAMEHLGFNAVSPDAVQFVRAIFSRELQQRKAGKPVRIPAAPKFDSESF